MNKKPREITVALAGNPNSGKTTIFNALTGAHQHVGNYPGVTVEKKEGRFNFGGYQVNVVDLPGTYSLTAYSLEERVARQFVVEEKPDVVVDILDGSNLERNLYLAVQFIELGIPVILVLNMSDMMKARGIMLNIEWFASAMGCPVVRTVGSKGEGIEELKKAIIALVEEPETFKGFRVDYGEKLEDVIKSLSSQLATDFELTAKYPIRWLALKLLEDDEEVRDTLVQRRGSESELFDELTRTRQQMISITGDPPELAIAAKKYNFIGELCDSCLTTAARPGLTASDKADRILTNRVLGPIILIAILYGVYKFTFWAGEYLMGWTELFFRKLDALAEWGIAEGLFSSLVRDGIIGGVGGVLGFVPLIVMMFLAIAIIEDTGYMARIAFVLDRLLRLFGLHGKSVLALIVSGGIPGGCAVPGIMATRTLRDPKERKATILVCGFMSCGAKIPVFAMLIGAFFAAHKGLMLLFITLFSWAIALLMALLLRKTLLKGEPAPFVMELPPYRLPTIRGLLIHTWHRAWMYIKKAGTIILAIAIILWAMMTFPGLSEEQEKEFEQRVAAAKLLDGSDEALAKIENEKAEKKLEVSIAGRIGRGLTVLTQFCGFDWRTNIALVGGFAAKEVVVSTFGTIYSLGEVEAEESEPLQKKLQQDKNWSPLVAFAVLLFMIIYVPCFVTVAVIKRETGSWLWAGFAMLYTTVLAYVIAVIVYQVGTLLNIGVT